MVLDEEAAHVEDTNMRNSTVTNRPAAVPPAPATGNAATNNTNNISESKNSKNFRLPLKVKDVQKPKTPPPRLLHPILLKIPMHLRFGFNGFLSNVLFMVVYNTAVQKFEHVATTSTIYSVVYFIFIPVGHACLSLLVFGWPERYIPSLMSNFPIGLTAIALGAALTAYLDKIEFNDYVDEIMKQNWTRRLIEQDLAALEKVPPPIPTRADDAESGEFYSSLVVLIVTGIWTFVLSVFINAPSEPNGSKKEQ